MNRIFNFDANMMPLRCLAVDDEPFALEMIREFIGRVPFLVLGAATSNPLEAMALIRKDPPDLLFLDIEMPEISGIELAQASGHPPYIIFTTAFSQYAVEGFNLNAIDYLLKPYSFERFLKAAHKALDTIKAIQSPPNGPVLHGSITVKVGYQNLRIELIEILWIEAMDNYVRIHTRKKIHTTLQSLKSISALLPPEYFCRIHKSFIVAISGIQSFNRDQVILEGQKLPVGRAYAAEFLKRMKDGSPQEGQ